ncbi:acyl carrier protein [Deinococcus sp. NW-56]|uniref:acyl carrier protein n=1 Tax=Deinococcus sp. NW-56 TaxID=2080419 RepID=UPI000CF54246|nr:acyl carrier protein [Deinococcus sp. NW-56]
MTNEQKLQNAFVEGLGIAAESEFEGLEYRGIEEWDSVAHMQLVSEIETAFDIMLETQDVIDMSSYPVARTIVAKYGITF